MPTLTLLPEPEAIALLEKDHLPYPRNGYAKSADEAVEIADKIGYPVVLKIVSMDVIHKSDIGGVKTNLQTPCDVHNAFIDIHNNLLEHIPNAKFDGILVCKQAAAGLELIVGGIHDAMFGPCLMVGLGGIFTEILKDISFRIIPFSKIDAIEMLQELKGYSILSGVRGGEKVDIDSLAEFLVKISTFLYQNSWIQEVDFNPVRISGNKIIILDARILH
jgi:acyl-CoA synthetase (NDP forming)